MSAPTKKHIKAILTKHRSEIIELDSPISAESWLGAMRAGGSGFVILNGTSYPKGELIDAVEAMSRVGQTNMDGI